MLVKDIMSNPVHTGSVNLKVSEALELMRKENISHLPVLDSENILVGIITESDILKLFPKKTLTSYELNLISRTPLRNIMSKNLETISPNEPLESAAQIMLEKNIGSLVVVENDRLLGLISDTDIFNSFTHALGIDSPGVRFTLHFKKQKGFLKELVAILDNEDAVINQVIKYGNQLFLKVETRDSLKLKEILETKGYQILSFIPG